MGGINFERRVYIRKVSENTSGNLVYQSWTTPDTGLKEILVSVVWKEGSNWKKAELRNLRDNPDRTNLSATFSGTLTAAGTGAALASATVRAQENPARYGETDAAGNYSFAIEPGSYTLLAMKSGYFSSVSQLYSITTTQSHNFQLPAMSSGAVRGTAWLRDHLVISQLVGSSVTVYGDTEWVEVFNPTTWTWTMATGLGTGANEVVQFRYRKRGRRSHPGYKLSHRFLAPQPLFLFANTGTLSRRGCRAADAVYDRTLISATWTSLKRNPSSAGHVTGYGARK